MLGHRRQKRTGMGEEHWRKSWFMKGLRKLQFPVDGTGLALKVPTSSMPVGGYQERPDPSKEMQTKPHRRDIGRGER